MLVIDMIFYWSQAAPQRAAIVQHDMTIAYRGLADMIDSIGDRIGRFNLDKREPVAVSIPVPAFMLATTFALMRSGYSVALANIPELPLLHRAGIRTLIYDLEGQAPSGGRNIRFDRSWLPSETVHTPFRPYDRRPSPDNVNLIIFTSGTTGLPKNIVQPGAALDQRLKYAVPSVSHEKILIRAGVSGSFGFYCACQALNTGKTACFAPNEDVALSLVDKLDIELIRASASQALGMVEVKKKNPGFHLRSLKEVAIGGSRIGPEGLEKIRAVLSPNVSNWYASTEAGLVAGAPCDAIEGTPGAVGFLMPWVELEIVDESGAVLASNEEGLVRCRTPQLLENLKLPEWQNTPSVRDGWFYPGDTGRVTADGILCISGRKSDVINRGGVKISGNRIEELLRAFPQIKESAVCAVEGRRGFDELWVAIVAQGPVNLDEIKDSLRKHEDVTIAPDEIFILDELPRGELGKVQKSRLKELMLERKKRSSESASFDRLFWTAKVQV